MALAKKGTIVDAENFDATESAKLLWKAVDGIGTDESTIVDVVSSCSNRQRQLIKSDFLKFYHKDLVKEFKSELRIRLSFDFKQLLQSLFLTPTEFDAICLKASMKGLGTDEKSLVEILLTRTPEEMILIKKEYHRRFGVELEDDVADDTSGDFRKIVFPLCRTKRKSGHSIDMDKARVTADEIHTTFTQFRGTDTPRYDLIGFCCSENFRQIRATFEAYEGLTGEPITALIDDEFHGDAAWALRSAFKCSNSVAGFFAERLHKSLDGIATDDDTLIRIVVSRSEIDLAEIIQIFEKRHSKSLDSKIKRHTSGQFKQLLLAILRGNAHGNTNIY